MCHHLSISILKCNGDTYGQRKYETFAHIQQNCEDSFLTLLKIARKLGKFHVNCVKVFWSWSTSHVTYSLAYPKHTAHYHLQDSLCIYFLQSLQSQHRPFLTLANLLLCLTVTKQPWKSHLLHIFQFQLDMSPANYKGSQTDTNAILRKFIMQPSV